MKEIGGYIELELPSKIRHYHKDAVPLNSGRNALRYIVKAYGIKDIYVPYFTCYVVWEALKEENCTLHFYHIDEKLKPNQSFDADAYIVYTNYYGICSKNIKELAKQYKNLIVDNTMAFFMKPYGIASFYSPRKFFGVPDGGYAVCDKKLSGEFPEGKSWHRFSHLIKRIDCGSNDAYLEFNQNDDSLLGEPITKMSSLTAGILSGVDYEKAKKHRIDNFLYLDKNLHKTNKMHFELDDNIPMYYPFYTTKPDLREKLIENKIYIPKCWRETTQTTDDKIELDIHAHILPLIIDQRYDKDDMDRILEVINGN